MTSDAGADGQPGLPLGLEWTGVHDVQPEFIDQIGVGLGSAASARQVPDSVVITFGRVQQPLVVGSSEQVAARVRQITTVPVKAVGRFIMSRERAVELRQILDMALKQYDDLVDQAEEGL